MITVPEITRGGSDEGVLGKGVASGVVDEESEEVSCCIDEDELECGDPDGRFRGRGGSGFTLTGVTGSRAGRGVIPIGGKSIALSSLTSGESLR